MNEYEIFHNGSSWTCEVRNDNDEVICHSAEDSPMEALKVAMENEKNPDE
jgi:hypothetical protein